MLAFMNAAIHKMNAFRQKTSTRKELPYASFFGIASIHRHFYIWHCHWQFFKCLHLSDAASQVHCDSAIPLHDMREQASLV